MNKDVKRTPGAMDRKSTVSDEELDALIANILAEDNENTAERYNHTAPAPIFDTTGAPAFEDPDKPIMPPDPPVRNFSNDYGSDQAERARRRAEKREQARLEAEAAHEDRWQIALMSVASVLCLGIIGILAYWLIAFF